ncbi:MAG: Uma2 family endonuclease [Xenococcaceae cyanobacterium MO_167.B27]|nr:Uma2 family endonuclease [Xenococcaceae cyanobacterium MO_167.B27]
MKAVVLNLEKVGLTDEQFYNLCQVNQNWNLERTAKGELVIMPPVGGESGQREADLITDLNIWNRQTQLGIVFSSSTIFSLPNGGDRSPDVAWIQGDRWNNLTAKEKKGFPPICPDFVIELRSQSDALKPLQTKMQEYLASGLSLGWLIDPQNNQVEIYRPNQDAEIIKLPNKLLGESILPGFILYLPIF